MLGLGLGICVVWCVAVEVATQIVRIGLSEFMSVIYDPHPQLAVPTPQPTAAQILTFVNVVCSDRGHANLCASFCVLGRSV